MVAATDALAAFLTIVNPSFEQITGSNPAYFDSQGRLRPGIWVAFTEIAGGTGLVSDNPIPGWEGEGQNGTTAILKGGSPPAQFAAIPNGANTLIASETGYVAQTLTNAFRAGFRYTFRIMAGRPLTLPLPEAWNGGQVVLAANREQIAFAQVPAGIQPGSFVEVEVSYSVAAGDSSVGKAIMVGIYTGNPGETHFDAASVEETPIASVVAEILPAVRVNWPTQSDTWYRVERASRLAAPDWTPVSPPMLGTSGQIGHFDTATNGVSYYWVVAVPPPSP